MRMSWTGCGSSSRCGRRKHSALLKRSVLACRRMDSFGRLLWGELTRSKSWTADWTRRRPERSCLKANFGSGKTHLLRLVREDALARGYAVSLVSLDAKSAVRFNRMDQIMGAICRGIELPQAQGRAGIRVLLDHVCRCIEERIGNPEYWEDLSSGGKWDYSERLESKAFYIALRAWYAGSADTRDLVEDWLEKPWEYRTQRQRLHRELVGSLRRVFIDPRRDWQFYSDKTLEFVPAGGYAESWALLRDISALARASGLSGFIILFDEFEDIITNLNNIKWQEDAFWNLFQFDRGRNFPGMTFFAVTPEFVQKCVARLIQKDRWDYDIAQFKQIPTFQMSPLEVGELEELAMRILEAHGIAYAWEPDLVMKAAQLDAIVQKAAAVQIQDRARHTITTVVRALDNLLQEAE